MKISEIVESANRNDIHNKIKQKQKSRMLDKVLQYIHKKAKEEPGNSINNIAFQISREMNLSNLDMTAKDLAQTYKDFAGIKEEGDEPVAQPPPITPQMLKQLEFHIDKMFAALGMDVEFTRHFIDRVNDPRNQQQITVQELARLFKETYRKWGKKIAQMGPDAQAVIKDMQTDINLPFVLNWDEQNKELDLVAKTIMRKKNFSTPNQQLPLEGTANEKAPPGREKQVKKLKGKFDDPGAPYAIAWAQHNKSGKPKKK